jgi:hypothetical protein
MREKPARSDRLNACRLKIGDTAECNSALHSQRAKIKICRCPDFAALRGKTNFTLAPGLFVVKVI